MKPYPGEYCFTKGGVAVPKIADRLYECLKSLKDKEIFLELKTESSTFYCNSKRLKFNKSGNTLTFVCYKDVKLELNLDSVKHYSFMLDKENNCERTSIETENSEFLDIFLNVEDYNSFKKHSEDPFNLFSDNEEPFVIFKNNNIKIEKG
jgi:hypothetical protein